MRGSRYNSGEALSLALGFGAQPTGHWSGCHAVLVDSEAPDVEAAYEHRYSYPYGIMVDINGRRFVDEGEDFFSYTYAKCGRKFCGYRGEPPTRFLTVRLARSCAQNTIVAPTFPPTLSKRWLKNCRGWIGRMWLRPSTTSTMPSMMLPSIPQKRRKVHQRD